MSTAPTKQKQAILHADLRYWILKVFLSNGRELEKKNPAAIVTSQTPGILYMDPYHGELTRAIRHEQITRICYSCKYLPTGLDSPIYDHVFDGQAVHLVGSLAFIGPMSLHPAEEVWPELTRTGYYGELPQFFK